ncbi:response regulator transcription factor [Flagellimonas halotolerans]|uniref:Response regulator transcription factor n=1 Tax=Flagellimonas halotolerans TaxID=3112164 RepID=A0ABU6ITK1_9FLAO|nr:MULTISPECIES: response regulator transcription factor [unclassified Allomuricauda]MEC3966575.1 response regulator transcription factor [Muricauda sp. SYSU M86414]MEC4266452.1 response regulator transcription factor [Muricauda sp. SYSU M84420]
MEKKPLKIAIIDNDDAIGGIYNQYFEENEAYELLGTFSSVQGLLSNFGRSHPDIIICEAMLNGISGIDGLEYFYRKNKDLKVLVMSQKNDFKLIKEAFKNGANGYLIKPMTKDRLFNALDTLNQHGIALELDVAKKIIGSFQTKSFEVFSKKENQIIELLTQGFTYKMIADKLFVTPSAVNFHIQNIYVKLNVNSKSEALRKLKEMEMQQLNAA